MPARPRIALTLTHLVGAPMPASHFESLPTSRPVVLRLELTAVDRLSCALSELRLEAPHLSAAGFPALQAWAQSLCSRITYLLEQIGPLEFDPAAGTVLVRSDPPDAQPAGNQYYEILLQSQGSGQFTIRRYQTSKGAAGRMPVDLFLTHEVLDKLVNDLIDTMP